MIVTSLRFDLVKIYYGMYLGVLLHIELGVGYSKEVVVNGMYWVTLAPLHPGVYTDTLIGRCLFKAAIPYIRDFSIYAAGKGERNSFPGET